MKAKSVRELVHDLLDIGMEHWGDQPTAHAIVQITSDGETYWGIEEMIYDEGEGGVVARIVPWPPGSEAVPRPPAHKVTPVYDTCDCGDGYPCGHGRFLYAIELEEPKPDAQIYIDAGEEVPSWLYSYSELSEMPEWLTTLLILGPELVASLQRCTEDLQFAINDSTDPGTEALGAVYEAKVLLGRLGRGVLALENR